MTTVEPARRRIAYVLTQDRGGPVDVTVELALAVREHGHDVRVFGPVPSRGGGRIADIHTEVHVAGKAALGARRRARRLVAEWRPDVVHAQDRRSGLVCAGLRTSEDGRRSVVVHTYHGVPDSVGESWFRDGSGGTPSRYDRATLAADAVVARRVARTVVPASAMGRFLTTRLRVPASRVVHIDNGLVLPPAAPPAGPVRRLLFVGLLVPRKGVHLLLEALAAADVDTGVRLDVVGDGPERPRLEARAAQLGLAGRVSFLGFRQDVPALLAEADAFVLPSSMEQQPLVLIEALGAGKPVLATDVGGVREMVADAGIVVPAGSPEHLRAGLEQLTAGSDGAAMGVRAAATARERFTVERCAERHLQLYAELLGRPAGDASD